MEIIRPRNDVEKDVKSGGFLDIRYWKQNDFYQKALVEIDNAFHKFAHTKKEPYDRTAALDYLNKKKSEIEQKIKKARDSKQDNVSINLNIDWDKFGGLDKFDLVNEEDTIETQIISGVKQPIKTGLHRDYESKDNGSKVCIFFNYEELKNDKNSNKKQQQETQNSTTKN